MIVSTAKLENRAGVVTEMHFKCAQTITGETKGRASRNDVLDTLVRACLKLVQS